MTTYVKFTPSTTSNFQFALTLDGQAYTCIVNWNLYGQRYYINIYDLNQNWIVTLPLISSPDDYDISLTAGYFTTTLVFRDSSQTFEISS